MALGPDDLTARARDAITAYYGFDPRAAGSAERMLATTAQIREAVTGFTDIGADEVMLYCWGTDPDQVDRLADALF